MGRGDGAAWAAPVGGGGVPLPAGAATAGDVRFQARPHPGDGVSITAEEYPAAVPPADCPGLGGALSRNGRDTARTRGASLHRGRVGSPSCALLAAGGAAGLAALGQPGGSAASDERAGGAPDTSRCAPAPPARARSTAVPGTSVDGCQGLWSPGGGAELCPGAGIVSTGWRDATALPDSAGLMYVLSKSRDIVDLTGAGGTARKAGAACGGADGPPDGICSPGADLILSGRLHRRLDLPGAGDRPHRRDDAAGPGTPSRPSARGDVPCPRGEYAVVPGLSSEGRAMQPRGAGAGPSLGPSLEPGDGP